MESSRAPASSASERRGEQLETLSVLLSESQGQNLALTVLYAPHSLDRGYLVVQRFRDRLVFKAHRLGVSLNSRLEINKEEEGYLGDVLARDEQGAG